MKLLDNNLYLEFNDAIECGMNGNYLSKAKSSGAKSFTFLDDPGDNRKVLIEYESLKPKYKEMVEKRFGNPYEHLAKEPIRKMVTKDNKAEEYFLSYRFDGNKFLPIETVNKYVVAASWLNMLVKAEASKKEIKKLLNLTVAQFFLKVEEIIKSDKIDLPSNYRRLKPRITEYKNIGYSCLIHKQFGNNNAKKVNTEVAESLLLEMIGDFRQYDDVYVAKKYNDWAAKHDHECITPGTVGNYRRKNYHLLIINREGNAAFRDTYGKEIKGKRPSAPLYMVESDDNHLDFFFLNPEDKTQHKHFYKYKAIVVTDSFNDYPLGFAYATKLTTEVVKYAYLNAMYHIKQLTDGWYLPHEVKTDRWALEQLRPFYHSLGNYFDTPVGSKRRGYIEQFFGSSLWKNSMKAGANNYTGNNITARGEGVNLEVVHASRKDYPTLDEAPQVIENFFHRLRHTVNDKTGKTKQQEWLEAFAKTSDDQKRAINDEQFLLKLGFVHAPQGRKNTITNGGIEPQINGVKYWFDVPEMFYLENVGKQVEVRYDPYDMSRVLITDNNHLRFIATTPEYQSRALADAKEGERARLNQLLSQKLGHVDYVVNESIKRKQVLSDYGVDAEALLKVGVPVLKEAKQAAELTYERKLISRDAYDPFAGM